ncbi:MAG TPA: endonuclease domain-containing protein [Dyella sp.]|uniref:endonuclease domain-containing protein n=1 Tax=Dyella sp. TaxID=1869338 RepID=UPI002D797E91|nr:endonuclease domain-containing protein [Dyella sp.]HET6553529.1 endonuclease domain-containing protein [Dyella sp.]
MQRLNADRARKLRIEQTDAEQLLWHRLRNRRLQGWKFRRQHEIGPCIADFVCPDADLIVELDGGQHGEQVIYDERRTLELQVMGYSVLRFWNNEVLKNMEGVLEVILEALASPGPLPPSGGSPRPSLPRDYLRVARRGEGVASTET